VASPTDGALPAAESRHPKLSRAIERSVGDVGTRVLTVRRVPGQASVSATVFLSGTGEEQAAGLAIVTRSGEAWKIVNFDLFPGPGGAGGGPGFSSFASLRSGRLRLRGGIVDQRSTSVALIGRRGDVLDEGEPENGAVVLLDSQSEGLQIRVLWNHQISSAVPVPQPKAFPTVDVTAVPDGDWEDAARSLVSNVTTDPEDVRGQLYCPLRNSECADALGAVVARTPTVIDVDPGPITTVYLSGDGRTSRLTLFFFPRVNGAVVAAAYDYRLTAA
jgi:hypothetical protein